MINHELMQDSCMARVCLTRHTLVTRLGRTCHSENAYRYCLCHTCHTCHSTSAGVGLYGGS
jgi:hypothetical protein